MLELKAIKKDYAAGSNTVHALKGIDLCFRKSEFVSILGPSGCGKTTMLNIIGGLDQYTSGDLLIRGRSTKQFKDRDWDNYRNHSIGFIFQSYNLIPHQTVLQNVELALTLSGVSKSERKKRAKAALEKVGLGQQLSKRPNALSGGQMQRVAIARALVNDPDIILADEPTGALDSETSVQVMDLLKEVAQDRLVIMVTHNPELAERYSTRIIRMLDGTITDDSMPLGEAEMSAGEAGVEATREAAGEVAVDTTGEAAKEVVKEAAGEAAKEAVKEAAGEAHRSEDREAADRLRRGRHVKKEKKASMSFFTAFMLSLRNLFTKKGRTTLTAFAGSIGIIGIALIFAISKGMTNYIDTVQEETLTSYPLTINRTNVDLSELLSAFSNARNTQSDHGDDAVYRKEALYNMMQSLLNVEEKENDLTAFKKYLEEEMAKPEEDGSLSKAVTGISYSYDLGLEVYTRNIDGEIIRSDAQQIVNGFMEEYISAGMSGGMGASGMMMSSGGSKLWQEMLSGKNGAPVSEVLHKQYDVVYGSWPNSYDEIVLVLDENNELSDVTLCALGLESKESMRGIMNDVMEGELHEREEGRWDYAEICEREYRVVLNSSCYAYDEQAGVYTDLRESDAGIRYLYDNAVPLKVVGIIRPNKDAASVMLESGIAYTSALTEYVLTESAKADQVRAQMANPSIDVITGLPFRESTGSLSESEKAAALKEHISQSSEKEKAAMYLAIKSILPDEELAASVAQAMGEMSRADMEEALRKVLSEQMGMSEETVSAYIAGMSDEGVAELMEQITAESVKMQYAQRIYAQFSGMSERELAAALDVESARYTTKQWAAYYDAVMEFSKSTYEENLLELGYVDLDAPASINIFASSFENKEIIEDAIKAYNAGKDEASRISYTDYMGIIMSSITVIIHAISYVLIAFVAISLIVSSIMIGVITLISVQERTKEIGILRAIGASKHNVSNMFNAETVIIGFTAGLLGIVISLLLCIPINGVIHAMTGVHNINAQLPVSAAVTLIIISMLLTLLSGLIPSRSAAKKDPVVALRTE